MESKENIDIVNISKQYEYSMNEESKKRIGCFYTDKFIVKYILRCALEERDVIENPFVKILDPSCGCGYFLVEAYDFLKNIYIKEIYKINSLHPQLKLLPEKIHDHILKNNIFGADIDENAVRIASAGLMQKCYEVNAEPNIICCDSLMDWENTYLAERGFWEGGFDIIIGNPPYIGHKKLSGAYRKVLNHIYGDIFRDKADISFCFIKSSIDRLRPGGKLCFITSRYFMESPSGRAIREYVKENTQIQSIVDFYGVRIMKGISVDPAIITVKKGCQDGKNQINVYKAKSSLKMIEGEDIFKDMKDGPHFQSFKLCQGSLKNDGWSLCSENTLSIIDKIERKSKYRLSDICVSFQGIITGCDKAFVIEKEDIEKYKIEKELVKPWIKSSSIDKYRVRKSKRYIIYSDLIDDTERYKNSIDYIEKYREKLILRRECRNGTRKWYQLQWGRDRALFDKRKIVFPYKSSKSRFAIDQGNYCSADVYGMYIKNDSLSISYEFLLGLLNSSLYEFYFKSFGKKLGEDMYDYYPNTVMRLMVPSQDNLIAQLAGDIISDRCGDAEDEYMKEIDRRVYDIFGIGDDDIRVIEGSV